MNYKELTSKVKENTNKTICKICNSSRLAIFAHTAKCKSCGVLLNFPYVLPRETDYLNQADSLEEIEKSKKLSL